MAGLSSPMARAGLAEARLTVVSGVGGKLPAAFLVEQGGRRILLDLGEGPEPGVLPDLSAVGPVDAICLSHAHIDHAGALHLRELLGDPPVYATDATWDEIPASVVPSGGRRLLPLQGQTAVAGIKVGTGRCGHAPGGVWMHLGLGNGLLYTGDWSIESILFPFDMPPPAATLITDASYGDRDESLSDQVRALVEAARKGAVLPVPSGGRGPEMALRLGDLGLPVRLCPVVHAETLRLARDRSGLIDPSSRRALAELAARAAVTADDVSPQDVVIATQANAEAGLAADLLGRRDEGFRFVFSSHVPAGTPAHDALKAGQGQWMPWNVHPRLSDNLDLIADLGATQVIPAFVEPDRSVVFADRSPVPLIWGASIDLWTA